MAVHCVFISSAATEGAEVDRALRASFSNVYRVGIEFWLVDTGRSADQIATSMAGIMLGRDKMFVARMSRDFAAVLSDAAKLWLTAPERSWRDRAGGRGVAEGGGSPFALAA